MGIIPAFLSILHSGGIYHGFGALKKGVNMTLIKNLKKVK